MPEDITIAESDSETQEPVTESNTNAAVEKMAKENEINHIEESDEEMPEPIDFGEEEEEADDDNQGQVSNKDAKLDEKIGGQGKGERKTNEIVLTEDIVDDAFTPASKLNKDSGKAKSRAKKNDAKVAMGIKKKTDTMEKKTKKLLVRKKDSPKKTAKHVTKGKAGGTVKATQTGDAKKAKNTTATEAKAKVVKAKKTIAKGSRANGKKQLLASKKDSGISPAKKQIQKKKAAKSTQTKSNNPAKKAKTVTTKQKKKTTKKKIIEDEEEEEDMNTVTGGDSESELEVDDEEPLQMTPVKHGIIGNLACSSRDTNTQALLDHSVHQLGKYRVVEYDAQSEHILDAYVVSKECKRGWGVLQALACGVPLVYSEWVSNSISQGKWLDMKLYRSDRFGASPRSIDGGDSLNNLLQGLRIKVKCVEKDAMSVRKLVRLCGGRVAETRMDVVVNDTKKEVEGAINVEKKWLADCIEAGVIIEYEPYLVSS